MKDPKVLGWHREAVDDDARVICDGEQDLVEVLRVFTKDVFAKTPTSRIYHLVYNYNEGKWDVYIGIDDMAPILCKEVEREPDYVWEDLYYLYRADWHAVIKMNGKWGVYNMVKEKITVPCQYSDIKAVKRGLVMVAAEDEGYWKILRAESGKEYLPYRVKSVSFSNYLPVKVVCEDKTRYYKDLDADVVFEVSE